MALGEKKTGAKQNPSGSESGALLVTVLLVTALLSLLAVAVLNYSSLSLNATSFYGKRTVALYLAESGANEALYRLDLDAASVVSRRYPADPPSFTNPAGLFGSDSSYQVWVSEVSPGLKSITAKGTYQGLSAVITVRAALPKGILFPRAIVETTPGRPYYLPDYKVTPVTFQLPEVPSGINSSGDLRLRNGETQTLDPGTYWFESIDLNNLATLKINGPATIYVTGKTGKGNREKEEEDGKVRLHLGASLETTGPVVFYVDGDLEVSDASTVQIGGPAQLQVAGDWQVDSLSSFLTAAPTALYAGENVSISSLSQVGNPVSPANLVVYLPTDRTGAEVELQRFSMFYGGLYAPTADVTIDFSWVTGSVVGSIVNLHNLGNVTYDPSLAEIVAPGGGWTVESGSWGVGP